jgi:hypothetical protein
MSTTTQDQVTQDEVVRKGRDWYERVIRPQVEAENFGKACIIDVDTGEYEVDSNSLAANKRMLAEKPGRRLYGIRVGFPAMGKMGGGWNLPPRTENGKTAK